MTLQHDFNDEAYCKALLGLFQAGDGAPPPTLAGREQPLRGLTGLLMRMEEGKAPPREAVLYGPRGNGKTVLLRQFEADCRAAGIGVIALNSSQVPTAVKLAKRLLEPETGTLQDGQDDAVTGEKENNEDQEPKKNTARAVLNKNLAKWRKKLDQVLTAPQLDVDSVSAKVPGVASLDLRKKTADDLDIALEGLLAARCYDKPLVVTLDEAHTLDLDVGWRLLNLSQQLRSAEGAPFLLVVSGTPNLRAHLGKMKASFWGRSEKLAIGRLDATATRDALVGPLQAKGISFDPDALARVVDDSQGYPYFIQLWGEALCEVLVNTKQGQQITASVADEAWPVVEEKRQDYYQDRYNEMKKQGLLDAAERVARTFAGRDILYESVVIRALTEASGVGEARALTQFDELSELGYLWQAPQTREKGAPPPPDIEPGIPSLMTHVSEVFQANRDAVREVPEARVSANENQAEDRNDGGGDKPKGMGQGQP